MPRFARNDRRVAFTLAEVLITLAIIGVVAAMTIPNLIANYEKRVTAIRVKKAYAELTQVLRLSQIDNGPISRWNMVSDGELGYTRNVMEEKILPYLKGVTECSTGIEYSCGMPVSGAGINYKLNNGTGMSVLAYKRESGNTLNVIISTNLNKGDKAVAGKDWFYFDVTDKGVIPSGWKEGLTREDVINGFYQDSYKLSSREEPTEVYYACKKGEDEMSDVKEVYNRYACTILLMLDNWEIKDDYPW